MEYLVLSVIFLCAVNVVGQIGPEICTPECLNGGICNESTCLCSGGYKGEYCQISPPSAVSTTPETPTVDGITDEPPTTPMVPTPPPPPPPTPSIFPETTPPTADPNTTTTFATPTKLPTPFTTIRIPVTSTKEPEPEPTKMIPTPPPPPPPSPSLFITPPESSTSKPSLEPTTRQSTIRTVFRTITPHPTTSKVEPTKKIDPVLIENGGVTITLEFPPTEFDNDEQMKFKTTIANNVNDFCSTNPENCDITGLHVGPNDVILYEIRGITEPEMAAILEMEGTDTVVSFYITHPSSSSVLVLNAEQLDTMLTENSDKISEELGYSFHRGALDVTPEPVTSTTLEPWVIATICVVGAAAGCIIVILVGLYMNTRNSGDKDHSVNLENQESHKMNGDVPKEANITTTISTQASQSDIILETKHVFIKHYGTDPVGGVDEVDAKNMSTQVTYQEILTATCLNEDGSYNHDSDTSYTTAPNVAIASLEPDANVVCTADVESPETNEITSSNDDAVVKSTSTSPEDLPPRPPNFLEGNSVIDDGAAINPSDNLVMKNIGDKTDNTFDNPAYFADTEIDETGELFTQL